MDSAYYRYDGDGQGPSVRPQQPQPQVSQQLPQFLFSSPLLQQQHQASGAPASVSGENGSRQYLVSTPMDTLFEQQQQQERRDVPLVPFSVSYSDAPPPTPIGARGWLADIRHLANSAYTALHHIKERPLRRLLLFALFTAFCFLLLRTTKPQDASTSLTDSESHRGICENGMHIHVLEWMLFAWSGMDILVSRIALTLQIIPPIAV